MDCSTTEVGNYIADAKVNGPFYETMTKIDSAKMNTMAKRAPMPVELKKNFAGVLALVEKDARAKLAKKAGTT